MNETEKVKESGWPKLSHSKSWMLMLLVPVLLGMLFLLSQINFLLFHVFTELFSIGVMWAIFLLVWNTQNIIDNRSVLFMGIAFFFIGLVDTLHILSYKGMGVFPGNDPNLATQFWIVGRYLQSITFLIAPLLLKRQFKSSHVVQVFAGVTTLLIVAVFVGIFPDCFLLESGLTAFKINSEYVIILILATAMWEFYSRREQFDPHILQLILLSLGTTILSELCFTFYVSVYGLSNLIGHALKIIAMLFLYKALIKIAIKDPFNLIFRDLKAREKALQVSEERFSSMFHEHDAIMLLIEPDTGEILNVNSAASIFYGYTRKELRKMNIQQITMLPTEELALARSQALKGEKNYFTFPQRLASGEIREVEVHSSPVISQEKKILFSIIHDITDRKQTEALLCQSKQLLEASQRIARVGGWELDLITNSLFWTDEAYRIYDTSPEDFNPTVDAGVSYYLPESRHIISDALQTAMDKGDGYDLILETLTTKGRRIDVRTTCEVTHSEGRPVKLTGIFQDITERKTNEAEKQSLEDQLLQAQKMDSIGTLAGGIAHDFNNILASVIGFTELALNAVEKQTPIADDLHEVYTAGLRAKDLVQQILTFARQSDEKLELIQIDLVIKEVLKFLRSSIPTTIEIKQDIVSTSLIMGNTTQIHRIMMNLCTNAAHAMDAEGGILEVTLNDITIDKATHMEGRHLKFGNYIEIKVSDTGDGIAPVNIDKIFEPYFTTKGLGEGTGMGLAMVHGIVETYGGKIFVENRLGKGAIFIIYLPVARGSKTHQQYKIEELPTGQERILFVDDEPQIAKMAHRILSQLGYTVTIKTNSLEALELFSSKPNDFDLVISDVTMPKMPGDLLTQELLEIRPDIPVILCTGYSKRLSAQKASDMGVKAIAYKPIVKEELAKKIRDVLDD